MKDKFYLLSAGLKNYPCNKRTHVSGKNNAIFVEREKRRTNVANEVMRRKDVIHDAYI